MKYSSLVVIALLLCLRSHAQHGSSDADEWKWQYDSTNDAWRQRVEMIQRDSNLTAHVKDSLVSLGSELDFFSLCHEHYVSSRHRARRELPELPITRCTFTNKLSVQIPVWGERITWLTLYNTADSMADRTFVGASAKEAELGANLPEGVYFIDATPAYQFQRAFVVKIGRYVITGPR